MVSIKTHRARAYGLGSAKSGTRDLWLQRLTSMLGLPLAMGLFITVARTSGLDYQAVHADLRQPVVTSILLLAIVNFCVHCISA